MLRSFSEGLQKILVRFSVLQLNGLDSAKVEEVTSPFVVRCVQRECRLADELLSLVVQVVVQIASQQAVDQRCDTFEVIVQD